MKNLLFSLVFVVTNCLAQGQSTEINSPISSDSATSKDSIISPWKAKGNISLLFNQSNFNNWLAGGENNLSGNLGVNYDFNYKKEDWTWDNKILASYGLLQTRNATFEKKTDDRFELNSLLGKQASGEWSYSFFLNLRTQFTQGFLYSKDVNGAEIRTKNTSIFSPGYLTFGPGMVWKKSENLRVNLSAMTTKMTFVDRGFTSGINYINRSYFGVDANKSMRYEMGFYAAVFYKLNLMTNVSAENSLNLYSNYLEDFQNVDINYSLSIVMKINRFLSANISVQAIYDDNAFKGFQTREVFGVGINYGF